MPKKKHFSKQELKWTYQRLRAKGLSHKKTYDEIQGMIETVEKNYEKEKK